MEGVSRPRGASEPEAETDVVTAPQVEPASGSSGEEVEMSVERPATAPAAIPTSGFTNVAAKGAANIASRFAPEPELPPAFSAHEVEVQALSTPSKNPQTPRATPAAVPDSQPEPQSDIEAPTLATPTLSDN